MAYAGLHNDDYIDAETAKILLSMYWMWQGPLHNCVYRRSFFRDMVLKGPYFSDFLVNVIYAHAARHIQPSDTRYATLLQDRPAIPTIQGLLILGGRQCAVGRNSEGWLYTGMAIRMIKDLGLHLPRRLRLATTEPDDLETWKRVYLSAYVWDKSISLCLGRPPSLTTMLYPLDCLYDHTDDQELWQPFYLGGLESIYASTPCYNTTTFSHFVRLSMIVNDAFDTVFGSRSRKFVFSRLKHIEQRLYEFYRTLPTELQMNESLASSGYPPPHICCLNILYHTMYILIYRPYFLNKGLGPSRDDALLEHAATVCTREATAVNKIFQAYGRAFANKRQTYLLSYCVYTAATIEVKQVGDPDPAISRAAVERLATTLAMLEEEAKQTPGIRRSIEIIRMRLQKQRQSSQTVEMARTQQETIAAAAMNALPTVSGDLGPPQLQYEAHGGDTSNAHAYGTHGMPTLGNDHNHTASMDALSQWPVSEGSFDLWNIPTPDVSGGFVPDSLSWYTMIE
ncbi:nitrogen assimilation transcription factor nirA [Exophiala viscosa]|uniref:Nitrogen assimilation transcription factor nirA n=1 Tax=Exophiala viscosa TaxID=2486360 RepID=A0AAN6IH37_9EURO|nr:nitrogen assimilation transcription factor nirA [Exophiala viscosa]